MGGCKRSLTNAIRYANERQQFGKSISSFGAIQYKLSEMAIAYALEAANWRVSNYIDDERNC